MEEDYKKIINEFETLKRNKKWIANINTEFFINFADYLIKGYKELQERDEERKQLIAHLENKICNQKEILRNGVNVVNLNANRMCEVFDLIPKSKVKGMIEELETIKEEHSKSFNWADWEDEDVYNEMIAWFKELLQEGDK